MLNQPRATIEAGELVTGLRSVWNLSSCHINSLISSLNENLSAG